MLRDEDLRKTLTASGIERAHRFDWSVVGEEIMNVYLHAMSENEKVILTSEARSWSKLFSREDD